ncbi:MAG: hypothetical protein QXS93_00980 [Candidatus Micrarchaeia archaeon]
MALVTTSRKAGPVTRRLARVLSSVFRCIYINRGKSSFNAVLTHAESLGCKRVVFIYEKHGNPNEIRAVHIGGKSTYKEVGSFIFNPIQIIRPRRFFPYLSYDRYAANFVHLFLERGELNKMQGKDVVEVTLEKGVLSISVNGIVIVALRKAN